MANQCFSQIFKLLLHSVKHVAIDLKATFMSKGPAVTHQDNYINYINYINYVYVVFMVVDNMGHWTKKAFSSGEHCRSKSRQRLLVG